MISNRTMRWHRPVLTILVMYFTFLGGTFVTDFSFWPRVFHHVVVTAVLIVWFISLWRRGAQVPATPLDAPILFVALVFTVATVFSRDPRVSVEALWQLGVHTLIFYIIVDIMRSWQPRAILEPIFFASAVVIIVGLAEFASWYFGLNWLPIFRQGWPEIGGVSQPIPPTIYRLSFTLGVSTFLSGYLALLIPVGLSWAIATAVPDTRKGLVVWLVGAVTVLVFSFSRGGLLSLGVSLPILFATFLWTKVDQHTGLVAALRGKWLVPITVLAVSLVGALGVALVSQQDAFGHSAGDKIRRNLWDSAWQVGMNNPVIGVGPYGFGRAIRPYRDQVITPDHFTSAHNIPLQLWAETGALGVIAYLLLFASGLVVAVRRWRTSGGADRLRIAGVAAALVGYTAHNMVDTLINTPILLPWMALVAFLVTPLKAADANTPSPIRQVFQNGAVFFVAASTVGWVISDVAQFHFQQALQLAARNDTEGAVIEMQDARDIDPAMGFYDFQYAQYLGELAEFQPSVLPKALDAYEDALTKERTYALNEANYAVLLDESGRVSEAVEHMQEAISWQSNDPIYVLGFAHYSEQAGSATAALDAYRAVLDLRPEWIASDYWVQSPLREQARQSFLEKHGLDTLTLDDLATMPALCWPTTTKLYMVEAIEPMPYMNSLCRAYQLLRLESNPGAAIDAATSAIAMDQAVSSGYVVRAEARLTADQLLFAERDAKLALFLQDTHAYYVLGRLALLRGDFTAAERYFVSGAPQVYQLQGWDVSIYARRGDLSLLPQFDVPGPTRYDFASLFALVDLYESQGRDSDAANVREIMQRIDPFIKFDSPAN